MTKDEHIKLIDTLNKKLQYLNLWSFDEDTNILTDLDAGCEFEVRHSNNYSIYWNDAYLSVSNEKLAHLIATKRYETNRDKLTGLLDIYANKGETE